MFKNKKGQDLSISTIVIAAIAVVVLVVIIAIFTGQMGNWVARLTGSGSPEKAQDSITYKCIPAESLYQNINSARAAYDKARTEGDATAISAAQEKLDEAIKAKNTRLNNCQEARIRNDANECRTASAGCQWVS